MKIIKQKVKFPIYKLYKKLDNDNGLDVYLFGADKLVGFFIVTKVYKHDMQGYMGTMTHEEYKDKLYKKLSINDIALQLIFI